MGALGFSRASRLQTRPQFTACYDRGRRYYTGLFVVFVRPNQAGLWRLGQAVSRKLGGAVRRNRIRRLVREFFRLHGPEMTLPLDVVVVPKRRVDARSLCLDAVDADLGPLLDRIRRDFGRPPREPEAEGKQ